MHKDEEFLFSQSAQKPTFNQEGHSMFITKQSPSLDVATRLASAGFVQALSVALEQDVDHHLKEGELIYTTVENQEVVGMSIFSTMGLSGEILYLAGTIFLPRVQQRGLASLVIQKAQNECGSVYLALRTQSPRMWSVGNALCQSWFPQLNAEVPEEFQRIGTEVSKRIGSTFPIAQRHYGGPLYGDKPTHRNPVLQQWWDSICNFERGDAVLCVGKF